MRHFVDSLLVAELIPTGARVLDLGTGPGFPAWPLACARRDLNVTAVDSGAKPLDFLRQVPLPNLELLQARGEDLTRRESYDVVTGRAIAPLPIQLELSAAPCRVGGLVIPFRTPAERQGFAAPFLRELGLELVEVREVALPGTDVVRAFPIYRKFRSTPKSFPRRWGVIKSSPLG